MSDSQNGSTDSKLVSWFLTSERGKRASAFRFEVALVILAVCTICGVPNAKELFDVVFIPLLAYIAGMRTADAHYKPDTSTIGLQPTQSSVSGDFGTVWRSEHQRTDWPDQSTGGQYNARYEGTGSYT